MSEIHLLLLHIKHLHRSHLTNSNEIEQKNEIKKKEKKKINAKRTLFQPRVMVEKDYKSRSIFCNKLCRNLRF